MDNDIPHGSTLWIEHKAAGDVYSRVKVRLERQPTAVEICPLCHRGQLSLVGHLVQMGVLDDKVYAVCRCPNCCGLTVFTYHIPTDTLILPEQESCDGTDV